ncbi:MAG: hypothetical protein HY363_04980 [Candidatus Aenigmarchaeota archaeon]|nr:hypothetical protein [Candidatus Aenigmarchaeota archaeon]
MSEQPSQEKPSISGKPEIQEEECRKLERSLANEEWIAPNEELDVLIKVEGPKYIPKNINPSGWLNDYILRTRIKLSDISTVLQDPYVVSVGFRRKEKEDYNQPGESNQNE